MLTHILCLYFLLQRISFMNHYEIVFLVHPNQSPQVQSMIGRYQNLIQQEHNGTIHRIEDWGRRVLEYPIANSHKAHYVLMNIQVTVECVDALVESFRYNDVILRHLVIRKKAAVTEHSSIYENEVLKKESRKKGADGKPQGRNTPKSDESSTSSEGGKDEQSVASA